MEEFSKASPIELKTRMLSRNRRERIVQVRWTTASEVADELETKGIDPYVLISVSHEGQETGRYLARLSEGKVCITGLSAGVNVIRAVIVWHASNGSSILKRWFLAKESSSSYFVRVLNCRGDGFRTDFGAKTGITRHSAAGEARVVVPGKARDPGLPRVIKRLIGAVDG